MHRMTLTPVNDCTITLCLEEIPGIGEKGVVVSECIVTKTGGSTSYTGKNNAGFHSWPKKYDQEIRNIIQAYFDGMKMQNHYGWLLGEQVAPVSFSIRSIDSPWGEDDGRS